MNCPYPSWILCHICGKSKRNNDEMILMVDSAAGGEGKLSACLIAISAAMGCQLYSLTTAKYVQAAGFCGSSLMIWVRLSSSGST